MSNLLSYDVHVITVVFILIIFLGLEMKLNRIEKTMKDIDRKVTKD